MAWYGLGSRNTVLTFNGNTTFKLYIVPNQSVLNEALVIQELPVGNGALDTGY